MNVTIENIHQDLDVLLECITVLAEGFPLVIVGNPGCGSVLFAQAMPSVMGPPSAEELDETMCYGGRSVRRPFRRPHHSCSIQQIVGTVDGPNYYPGEAALANHGVMLLDNLEAFERVTVTWLMELASQVQHTDNPSFHVTGKVMSAKIKSKIRLIMTIHPEVADASLKLELSRAGAYLVEFAVPTGYSLNGKGPLCTEAAHQHWLECLHR